MSRKWLPMLAALACLLGAGCATTPVQQGAAVGGALGAGMGAIIGHQSGHQGEGALIGAGAGAIAGALLGDQVEQNRRKPKPVHIHYATRRTTPRRSGHFETRIVRSRTGERYEERIWLSH